MNPDQEFDDKGRPTHDDLKNPYSTRDDHLNAGSEKSSGGDEFLPSDGSGAILINLFCVLVIAAVVGFILFLQQFAQEPESQATPQAELAESIIRAKIALGFKSLIESNPGLQNQENELQKIPFGITGSVRVRQAEAILVSELESADDALVILEKLREKASKLGYTFSENENKTNMLLESLFHDSAAALSPSDKAHLESELLWFGQLGLHPDIDQKKPDPKRLDILQGAESTVLVFAALSLLILICLAVGFIGGIVMLVFYQGDKLLIRTRPFTNEKSIYLEAFTVWIFTFLLFQLVIGLFAGSLHPLVANIIVFSASFVAAIMWTAIRGKFDRQSRSDIGFCGNPLTEVPVAIWSYVCSMPLVAAGLFTSFLLLDIYATPTEPSLRASGPTHPIVGWIVGGDQVSIALIFIVACVCAPIVEETMFRGFLYRALRDGSYRLGHVGSVLVSALVNGLAFAAIHPQGVFFIPALCSLAIGFSFAREWRGSLWAPMIMHAIHNGILTATLVFIVSA